MAKKKRGDSAPEKKRPKVRPRRLRIRIVALCHLRDVTPKEIATAAGLPVATVQYHFGALEQEGWIRVCRTEAVSNGVRNWYTADHLKIIGDKEFEQMNEQGRSEISEAVLKHYLKICKLAWEKGTLDAQPDSQFSQVLMRLDRKGWNDVQKTLDNCLERILEFMVEAEMRMRDGSEESIPTVVHLGGFEVPREVFENSKELQL
ncbi:MAG TPA: winged helix-turn-helix domain-containing protein [Solirubrobacterales bacterium]|nr:winged helix-turn-helix domain-containing protein [Solirubrobacterales bacterium]